MEILSLSKFREAFEAKQRSWRESVIAEKRAIISQEKATLLRVISESMPLFYGLYKKDLESAEPDIFVDWTRESGMHYCTYVRIENYIFALKGRDVIVAAWAGSRYLATIPKDCQEGDSILYEALRGV